MTAITLVDAEPLPDYRLRLRYANGVEGVVDLSEYAGRGVFALWNDHSRFEQVVVAPHNAVSWSDEVDLCADALYLRLTEKKPEDLFETLL